MEIINRIPAVRIIQSGTAILNFWMVMVIIPAIRVMMLVIFNFFMDFGVAFIAKVVNDLTTCYWR